MKKNKWILFFLAIIGLLIWKNNIYKEKEMNKYKDLSQKHLSLFLLMYDWLRFKQRDKDIVGYFVQNNYKRIAIYGMSYVARALINELKNSNIEICYGIDRSKSAYSSEVKIISMDECLDEVDVVVVTPILAYTQIEKELREKIDCDIVSIEDVIYW